MGSFVKSQRSPWRAPIATLLILCFLCPYLPTSVRAEEPPKSPYKRVDDEASKAGKLYEEAAKETPLEMATRRNVLGSFAMAFSLMSAWYLKSAHYSVSTLRQDLYDILKRAYVKSTIDRAPEVTSRLPSHGVATEVALAKPEVSVPSDVRPGNAPSRKYLSSLLSDPWQAAYDRLVAAGKTRNPITSKAYTKAYESYRELMANSGVKIPDLATHLKEVTLTNPALLPAQGVVTETNIAEAVTKVPADVRPANAPNRDWLAKFRSDPWQAAMDRLSASAAKGGEFWKTKEYAAAYEKYRELMLSCDVTIPELATHVRGLDPASPTVLPAEGAVAPKTVVNPEVLVRADVCPANASKAEWRKLYSRITVSGTERNALSFKEYEAAYKEYRVFMARYNVAIPELMTFLRETDFVPALTQLQIKLRTAMATASAELEAALADYVRSVQMASNGEVRFIAEAMKAPQAEIANMIDRLTPPGAVTTGEPIAAAPRADVRLPSGSDRLPTLAADGGPLEAEWIRLNEAVKKANGLTDYKAAYGEYREFLIRHNGAPIAEAAEHLHGLGATPPGALSTDTAIVEVSKRYANLLSGAQEVAPEVLKVTGYTLKVPSAKTIAEGVNIPKTLLKDLVALNRQLTRAGFGWSVSKLRNFWDLLMLAPRAGWGTVKIALWRGRRYSIPTLIAAGGLYLLWKAYVTPEHQQVFDAKLPGTLRDLVEIQKHFQEDPLYGMVRYMWNSPGMWKIDPDPKISDEARAKIIRTHEILKECPFQQDSLTDRKLLLQLLHEAQVEAGLENAIELDLVQFADYTPTETTWRIFWRKVIEFARGNPIRADLSTRDSALFFGPNNDGKDGLVAHFARYSHWRGWTNIAKVAEGKAKLFKSLNESFKDEDERQQFLDKFKDEPETRKLWEEITYPVKRVP